MRSAFKGGLWILMAATSNQREVRRSLFWSAVVAFVLGGAWLGLELALRGDRLRVSFIPEIIIGLSIAGVFIGLAIRPRVTMSGEFLVNAEITMLALCTMFMLPASMLAIYGVAIVLSAGIVLLSLAAWVAIVALAGLLQLVMWALGLGGLIGGGALGAEADHPAALAGGAGVGALVGGGIAAAIGSRFSLSVGECFDGTIWRRAIAWDDWIPDWDFVLAALRQALSHIDHNYAISLIAMTCCGLAVGLLSAIMVRYIRQQLMRNVRLRNYLPVASAPAPDELGVVTMQMLSPLFVYLLIAWLALAIWILLF